MIFRPSPSAGMYTWTEIHLEFFSVGACVFFWVNFGSLGGRFGEVVPPCPTMSLHISAYTTIFHPYPTLSCRILRYPTYPIISYHIPLYPTTYPTTSHHILPYPIISHHIQRRLWVTLGQLWQPLRSLCSCVNELSEADVSGCRSWCGS